MKDTVDLLNLAKELELTAEFMYFDFGKSRRDLYLAADCLYDVVYELIKHRKQYITDRTKVDTIVPRFDYDNESLVWDAFSEELKNKICEASDFLLELIKNNSRKGEAKGT